MNRLLQRTLIATSLGVLASSPALADAGHTMPRNVPPIYLQECAWFD